METDKVIIEARAKIIWGEPLESVRYFLELNGIARTEADARIKEFVAERKAEIRKIGTRKVILGVTLLSFAGIFLYFLVKSYDKNSGYLHTSPSSEGKGLGGLILAAFYGLWKLVDGICDLVRPQSEEGSISDMME